MKIYNKLQSKITPPKSLGQIIKIRSAQISIDQVRNGKAVFLSAPAGYGKTTSIASWVHQSDMPCSWLTLEADDDTPEQFVCCLAASVSKNLPVWRHNTAMLCEDTETLTDALLLFFNRLESPVCLVFDDLHHIKSLSVIMLLYRLISNLPSNVYIIIASRSELPKPLYALQARQRVVQVTQEVLSFGNDDIRRFFEQRDILLSAEQAAECLRNTKGWVLALVAMSIAHRKSNDPYDVTRCIGSDYIYRFLYEEIWARLDDDVQTFLLKTHIFKDITISLAYAVSGQQDCARILYELYESGTFTIRYGETDSSYAYHDIFRQFLKEQSAFSNINTSALHIDAAVYFESCGDIASALMHYRHAGNTGEVLRLIREYPKEILNTLSAQKVIEIIDSLQSHDVFSDIETCVCYEWALQHIRNPKKAQAFISVIEEYLSAQRTMMTKDKIKRVELEIIAMKYPFIIVDKNLSKMLECLETLYMTKVTDPIVYNPDMIQALYGCEFTLRDTASGFYGRHLFFTEVFDAMQSDTFAGLKRQMMSHTPIRVAASEVLYELGKTSNALKLLPGSIERALAEKNYKAYMPAMICLANVELSSGEFADAVAAVDQCTSILEKNEEDLALQTLQAYKARMDMLLLNRKTVKDWAANVPISAYDDVSDISRHALYQYLTLLQALATSHRWTIARLLCDNIVRMLSRLPDLVYKSQAIFWDAYIALKQNDASLPRKVDDMLRLGVEDGYYRTFVDFGHPFFELIKHTVNAGCFDTALNGYVHTLHEMSTAFVAKIDILLSSSLKLTMREKSVLTGLSQGLSNQEIADKMYLSLQTVKNHTSSIYKKLGVSGRRSAVQKAYSLGLISGTSLSNMFS